MKRFHLLLFFLILCIRLWSLASTDASQKQYLITGLDYKTALDLSNRSDDPQAQTIAGWFFLTQQWNGKQAEKLFTKALSLNSHMAMANAGLGLYYELVGEQTKAILCYGNAAEDQPDWPFGGAMLHRAAQLSPINNCNDYLQEVCTALMDAPGVDSHLNDLATYLMASILQDAGDRESSQKLLGMMGFIDQWQILGPIPAEGRLAAAPTPVESYPNQFTPVKIGEEIFLWRTLPFGTNNAEVPLSDLMLPNDASVAYAATTVELDHDQEVRLLFGGPGLDRVWIDGGLLLSEDEERAIRPDQLTRELKLVRGKHLILVKTVCRSAGGDLNFTLRFTDTFNRRLKLRTSASNNDLVDAGKRTKILSVESPDLLAPWAIDANSLTGDPLAFFWKGNLAERFLPVGSDRNLAWQLMNQCNQKLPNFLPGHMAAGWASSIPDIQDAEYDLVLAQEPNAFGAGLLKAKVLLNRHQNLVASQLFSQIHSQNPENIEAIYYLDYTLVDSGLWDKAYTLIHDESPGLKAYFYLKYLEDLSLYHINPLAKSLQDYIATLDLQPSNNAVRLRLVELMQALGKNESAVEILRQGIRINPYDNQLYIALVETLQGANQLVQAQQEGLKALSLFPDSPRLNELLGLMAETTHDIDGAKKYYQKVLDVSPQNQNVAERLGWLNPPEEDYYHPYRIAAETMINTDVPPELLSQAQALVLLDQTVRRINKDGTSRITRHLIIRILDEEGGQMNNSQGILFSPDLDQLKVINARVLSPDGSEWTTTAYNDQQVSDPNRKLFYHYIYRVYHFPHVSVGMVIDFEYALESGAEKLYGGAFYDYHLFGAEYPTLRSDYVVIAPQSKPLYEKSYRGAPQPEISIRKNTGEVVHRYTMSNIAATPVEDASPPVSEMVPEVRISGFSSWEEIGKWYWGLAHDRINPTTELEQLCQSIITTEPSSYLTAIQSYVARQIRYVGLELGISGYQPRQASEILSSRYGDCKDKTTLFLSMLKTIGQNGDIVLLATRNNNYLVDPEFPTIGIFNHAITALPQGKDNLLFTDPTADYNGLYELPWNDQGVWVLLVGQDLFKLVKTPEIKAEDNCDITTTELLLDADGSSIGHRKISYGPINSPLQRERFSLSDRRQSLLEEFWSYYWAGTNLSNLVFSDTQNINQPMGMSYDIKIPHFTYATSQIMRLPLTLFLRSPGSRWTSSISRQTPLLLGAPNTSIDTLVYHLPEGSEVVKSPEDVDLLCPFGEFKITTQLTGNTLTINYYMKISASRIETKDYADFRQAMLAIDKAEAERIMVKLTQ